MNPAEFWIAIDGGGVASTDGCFIHQSGSDGSWMVIWINWMSRWLILSFTTSISHSLNNSHLQSTSIEHQSVRHQFIIFIKIVQAKDQTDPCFNRDHRGRRPREWYDHLECGPSRLMASRCWASLQRSSQSIIWISKSNMLCDGDIESVSNLWSTCKSRKQ